MTSAYNSMTQRVHTPCDTHRATSWLLGFRSEMR